MRNCENCNPRGGKKADVTLLYYQQTCGPEDIYGDMTVTNVKLRSK